ncbi:MAG TPA: tetratricopeptide repeat protein [Vicinamibacterales bacterium]|jgi:tetratricopeptide (TPR) repeat protein|nr:tetratricopeptide repeat protein [Vicinamibacterales bacterium]
MTALFASLAAVLALAGQATHAPDDYKRLIDHYLASGAADVPSALLAWPPDPLQEAVVETINPRKAEQKASFYPASSRDDLVRWLEAAAMAHLEAARLAVRNERSDQAAWLLASGRTVITRLRSIVDPRRRRSLVGPALRTAEAEPAFAARWFVAGGELLHGTPRLGAAHTHFEAAMDAYPKDARIRLGFGTVNEMEAADSVLEIVATHGPPNRTRQDAETRRRRLLREAASAYEMTLKLNPAEVEARVRLGRTMMLQNRRREATTTLEAVRSSKPTPSLTYLACTLLALVQHQSGRAKEAERLYLEALAAWPDGQRAAIGLSHAQWLQRQLLTTDFLHRPPDRRPDPWAAYSLGQFTRVDTSIAELRKTIWP